jgi:hypothetical protein
MTKKRTRNSTGRGGGCGDGPAPTTTIPRRRRRRRLPAPPANAPPSSSSTSSTFDAWLSSQHVWYNRALLDLRRDSSSSSSAPCAIYARSNIREGDLLARVPKSAVLSRHTSACASLLERQRLGGGLALAVAVMCELLRGEQSRWHGYLRTLPWETGEAGVPALWVTKSEEEEGEGGRGGNGGNTHHTPAERALVGTEAQGLARKDAGDVARDYRTIVEPALVGTPSRMRAWLEAVGARKGGGGDNDPALPLPSLALFRRAASLVSSRAFRVDAWHGDAMVAVADAFNHKASCVSLGEGYVVGELQEQQEEEEKEEEETRRRRKGAPHDDDEEEQAIQQQQQQQQRPASSVQSSAPPEAWRRWGLPLRLEIAIISDDEEEEEGEDEDEEDEDDGDDKTELVAAAPSSCFPGVLRIVAASDVPAGREVHNTYGELGNLDLVRKYGFCLRPPPPRAAEEEGGRGCEAALPPQARRLGINRVSNPFDRVRLSPQALIEGALALLVVGEGPTTTTTTTAVGRAAAAAATAAAAAQGRKKGTLAPFLTREELIERVAWLKSATDLLDAALGEASEEGQEEEEEEAEESESGNGSSGSQATEEESGSGNGGSGSQATEEDEEEEEEDDDDDEDDEDDAEPPIETPEQRSERFAADRAAAERLVAAVVAAGAGSSSSFLPPDNPLPARLLGDGAVAALPGAAISRAAFLTLRTLTAPTAEFKAWQSVNDALAPGEALARAAAAARRRRWVRRGAAATADPLADAFSDEVPVVMGEAASWPPAARAVLAFALARRLELYGGARAGGGGGGGKRKAAAAAKQAAAATLPSLTWWTSALGLLPAFDVRALEEGEGEEFERDNEKGLTAARGLRAAEQRLLLHALCAAAAAGG